MSPIVSVVMAVRNGWPHIEEAVESILQQSFVDLEFLIVDDASNDKKMQSFLKNLSDKRVRQLRNKRHLGLSASLNKGFDAARGKYIARMDHDDVSLRERLSNQVDFLEANPKLDILGTWVKVIGSKREQIWRYSTTDTEIRAEFLFNSALVHSSVMMRRASLRRYGFRYSLKIRRAQDYELWTRIGTKLRFANLDQALLQYRLHSQQVGRLHSREQQLVASNVRKRQLRKLAIEANSQQLTLHNSISAWKFPGTVVGLREVEAWLLLLKEQNQKHEAFDPAALESSLTKRWWAACRSAILLGRSAWRLYVSSPLAGGENRFQELEFWAKATAHEMGLR